MLHQKRPVRPSIGIRHPTDEPKVVAASIENQALPNFIRIAVHTTHIA